MYAASIRVFGPEEPVVPAAPHRPVEAFKRDHRYFPPGRLRIATNKNV
jgi:hypothetical protein